MPTLRAGDHPRSLLKLELTYSELLERMGQHVDLHRELANVGVQILQEVDAQTFGPTGDLAQAIRAGAHGGGPFNWRDLKAKTRERKQALMQRGSAMADLSERMASLKRRSGSMRSVPAAHRRAAMGEVAQQMRRLGAGGVMRRSRLIGSRVQFGSGGPRRLGGLFQSKREQVISDNVWVETGRILHDVVEQAIYKAGRDKAGRDGGNVKSGKAGLRRVKITRVGGARVDYQVLIDEKADYWRFANRKRRLFAFTAEARRRFQQIADERIAKHASQVLGGLSPEAAA